MAAYPLNLRRVHSRRHSIHAPHPSLLTKSKAHKKRQAEQRRNQEIQQLQDRLSALGAGGGGDEYEELKSDDDSCTFVHAGQQLARGVTASSRGAAGELTEVGFQQPSNGGSAQLL